MTTVLKKVLEDHVMFHSFQMTKITIISKSYVRGRGYMWFKRQALAKVRGFLNVNIRLCWLRVRTDILG